MAYKSVQIDHFYAMAGKNVRRKLEKMSFYMHTHTHVYLIHIHIYIHYIYIDEIKQKKPTQTNKQTKKKPPNSKILKEKQRLIMRG